MKEDSVSFEFLEIREPIFEMRRYLGIPFKVEVGVNTTPIVGKTYAHPHLGFEYTVLAIEPLMVARIAIHT